MKRKTKFKVTNLSIFEDAIIDELIKDFEVDDKIEVVTSFLNLPRKEKLIKLRAVIVDKIYKVEDKEISVEYSVEISDELIDAYSALYRQFTGKIEESSEPQVDSWSDEKTTDKNTKKTKKKDTTD